MESTNAKFSGWSVLAGCILLMVFASGLTAYTIGIYMYPICEEFGFSNASYSMAVTGSSIVNALTSFFLVQYLSKGSKNTMKLIMLAAALTTGIGYICCSFCTQLWQFICMYAFWNLGFNMLTYTPVSMMINNWFPTKSALFTGIAFAGGNMGGAIFNTVLSRVIDSSGWRQAFVIGGIFCLVGSLLGILLVKRSPAEYGQIPYAAKADAKNGQSSTQAVWNGVSKAEALRSPAIFFMIIAMLISGILGASVASQVVNNLCQNGWDIASAGFVMTIYTLFGIAGNILSAGVINRIGVKKGAVLFSCVVIAALSCLILAGSIKPLAYLFAAFYGLACVMTGLVPTQAVIATFGRKDYAGIYGFVYTFYLIGCSAGTPLVALLADNLGYKLAWCVIIVLIVVLMFSYSICFQYGEKFKKQVSK